MIFKMLFSGRKPEQTPLPPPLTTVAGALSADGPDPLVRLHGVGKSYSTPNGPLWALQNIDLTIGQGEFVAVMGKSGAGKSTLINMMAAIDRLTRGEIWVGDTPVHTLNEEKGAIWRSTNIGVVFQQFQLMPMLTCLENVMMPMDFANKYGSIRQRRQRAMTLLEQLDIGGHAHKPPSAVSGGQRQRVAIARALANDPQLILADEPTGNLDSATAAAVFGVFADLVERGKTILMVTHDRDLIQKTDRSLTLVDGRWQM